MVISNENNFGGLFFGLPREVIEKNKLAPFMVAEFNPKKLCLKNFEKTVKIDLDLDKEALRIIRECKKLMGFASIDETVNSISAWYFGLKQGCVYLYPKGYLSGKFELIEDYEKSLKKNSLE